MQSHITSAYNDNAIDFTHYPVKNLTNVLMKK